MLICKPLPNGAGLQGQVGDVCVVRVAQLLSHHVRGQSPSKHILCIFTLCHFLEIRTEIQNRLDIIMATSSTQYLRGCF